MQIGLIRGHRISTGLCPPSACTLTSDVTLDYYRQNYDHRNYFSTDPNHPELGGCIVRHDDIYGYGRS